MEHSHGAPTDGIPSPHLIHVAGKFIVQHYETAPDHSQHSLTGIYRYRTTGIGEETPDQGTGPEK